MPTVKKEEEEKPPSIEVKQLQRYYTVLRDFMAHLHSRAEIYPPNHEFTQEELSSITPFDIIQWMNMKLYNKENPGPDDRPLNGSHHTLDYYKKSISYFMPSKEMEWDCIHMVGNPTKCKEMSDAIKRVKDFDMDTGSSSKKRKAHVNMTTKPPNVAKMPRNSLPPNFAPNNIPGMTMMPMQGVPVTKDGMAIQGVLRTMHSQNASFIDLFGTLSRSLEQFKTTLQSNNNQINSILMNLNTASVPNIPNQVAYNINGGGGAVMMGGGGGEVQQQKTVSTGMLDWQYVHADGVRRRVPPTWTFPHSNLQDMYMHWHCGDYQNRISPMKYFQNTDVSFLGKRARMNLNEVKNLMATIDEEATRKGKVPAPTMTLNQAAACFQAGVTGFKFSATTPTGKSRNIMRLKWSTLTKYNKQHEVKAEEGPAIDPEEKARQEFVEISPDDPPHDNMWYEHDDGVKRRVPSTYKFPMLGLEDMYVMWHCGQEEAKIAPMKIFQSTDFQGSPMVKRGKTNLSEVRTIMTLIDLAAAKKGMKIKPIMTESEARECCREGHTALNIPVSSKEGKSRDILKMKWSSASRLKNKGDDDGGDDGGDGDGDGDGDADDTAEAEAKKAGGESDAEEAEAEPEADPEDDTLADLELPEAEVDV